MNNTSNPHDFLAGSLCIFMGINPDDTQMRAFALGYTFALSDANVTSLAQAREFGNVLFRTMVDARGREALRADWADIAADWADTFVKSGS